MIISRVRQRRVAERIQVSEQEVKNFLASDMGKMQMSEEYRLANILIPTPEAANSDDIQKAARKVGELYQQLRQGADFGQVAIANSASENALEGGEMGWRKAAQLPPDFAKMLSSMAVGDITQPIRIPNGFILLKLEEKRGGGENVLRDEVHVRHILIKPSEIRSEAATKQLAERLYERIQNGEDFAELAKSFGRPRFGTQRRRPQLGRPEQPGTGVPRADGRRPARRGDQAIQDPVRLARPGSAGPSRYRQHRTGA